MPNYFNRRNVLKSAGLAAGVGLMASSRGFAAEALKNVRVGVVGTGGRGTYLLSNLVRLDNGTPPDQNVYDAVTWSVISPLTELSVGAKSMAVDFPDFTRGKWKNTPPISFA